MSLIIATLFRIPTAYLYSHTLENLVEPGNLTGHQAKRALSHLEVQGGAKAEGLREGMCVSITRPLTGEQETVQPSPKPVNKPEASWNALRVSLEGSLL